MDETQSKPANHWFHFPLQAIAIAFCVYFYFYLPKSGKPLLVLSAVVAVMMLMDMRPLHKGIYVAIILGLVLIENRALNKERADFSQEESNRRKEENDRFQGIADGIQRSIANSATQFTVTMGKTNQVLQNITGGNSFAYVAPQNFYGDQFPGIVWNNGEQALTGLTLTIAHTSDPVQVWGAAFFQPIFIGTVGPHEHAPIPGFVFRPRADEKSGQDNYWIMLSAQNGTASQSIYFRKDKNNPANWAYSFQVSKQVLLDKPQSQKIMMKGNPIPKGTRVTTYKLLLYRGWSDELAATTKKP
jgi:hypothetical protein